MLKRSIVVSGGMHLAVIVAATVAWPHALDLSDEIPPVVPVDLVQVADVTNIAPTVVETPKAEPPPDAPTPQPEAAPPPEAELAPDLDKTPKPKPKDVPKQAEQAAPAPAKPALPRRKPAPQSKFDVDSVIALLDKRAPRPEPTPPNAKPAEQTVKGIGNQDAMTMDIKDALLAQMRMCWSPPIGAPNPEQLIVQIRVFLAPDGRLLQAQVEPATRAAAAANPYLRAAAEAAYYAIGKCSPYKYLPPDRYDSWKEIVMTFDPSKMIAG